MNILFGNELYYLVDFLEKKLNDSVDIYSYKSGSASQITSFIYTDDIYELCINGRKIITWIRDNNCRYYGLDIELLFVFVNNKFKTELNEFDLFMFEFMYEVKEFYKKEIYETSI